MSRFDELYAKTHPVVEETEKHIEKDSAVEDFDAEDVDDVEVEAEMQEGEEVDAGDNNND